MMKVVALTFHEFGLIEIPLRRYDRLMETYGGFFHLACALITLRKVLK